MTPPLPLAELVKELRVDINVARHDGHMGTVELLESAVHYLAVLPLGRCETCRHCHYKPNDRDYRSICGHPLAIDANKGNEMMTPWPFGCTLYQPAPPAAGEETR